MARSPSVALVTASSCRNLDEDLAPLEAALLGRGVDVAVVDWDDPAASWSGYGLVVVRSTWDYVDRLEEFLSWVDHVDSVTRIANPAAVLRWNTDKRYLLDLAAAGVPTIPTTVVDPGGEVRCPSTNEVVVKPVVSAGARDTERYASGQRSEAEAHAHRLLDAGRSVLIQPYFEGVDEAGETAVVFVAGELSHGFRKGPILRPGTGFVGDLYREEDIGPRRPSGPEMEVARGALAAVPAAGPRDLLYARADLVPGPGGEPVVLELELTEPSLFHAHAPGSLDRFAAAIERFAAAGHSS